jgi:hypothetical protein
MLWGKRKPGPAASRRSWAFRPTRQTLEGRTLLAIDLNNIATAPYGVLQAGLGGQGVGWSVAEVGDTNGDGFDDFVLGAPTINAGGSVPTLGSGGAPVAYLVFGSANANNSTQSWLTLTTGQRIGDLGQLGNLNQTNPVTGNPTFPFNGITFTGQANSSLGASVAGVGNIDGNGAGISSFMIGAPGADGGNGRAYLVYGSGALSQLTNKTINLDSPLNGVNVLTFANSNSGSRSGRSVGSSQFFLNDGTLGVAIGAPNATVTGNAGQGAVYVVSGLFLRPARTTTVDLSTVGQSGGPAGLIIAGASSGDATGRSVAGVGDVNGATNATGQVITDLAIGAPQVGDTGAANGPGKAFLLYGGPALAPFITTIGGVRVLPLSSVTNANPTLGAVFNGDTSGDETGWAVSTAGDFNSDGFGDFLIGSPFWNTGQGRATMIYGASGTAAPGGVYDIGNLPSTVSFAELDGQSGDAHAGFSVGAAGPIISGVPEEILVGTPGFNGGAGAVFVIPGQTGLFGIQTLSESTPVFGTEITLSQPTGVANYLGTSVGGNLFVNSTGQTADNDARSDFVLGVPNFPLSSTSPRLGAGAGYMMEGAFFPLQTPTVSQLTSTIGIDAPFSPPFRINATTPTQMLIYVFSSTTSGNPNFVPLRDLDPTTVKVNGVAFPGATIAADPVDENNDGLQDAIITITPRSALNLSAATTLITLTARTLSTSPNANESYSGSAAVIVAGAGPGGGGLASSRTAALGLNSAQIPEFGGQLIPQPQTLSRLRWKPLPQAVAYNQYLPPNGFTRRLTNFYHPRHTTWPGSQHEHGTSHSSTLSQSVSRRGRFPAGVYGGPIFHNQQPTIPPSLHRTRR